MRHRSKRRDSNHFELMAHAESIGFSVLDTSQLGKGLDLLVAIRGKHGKGDTIRIEIKDGAKIPSKRKLLESEQDVFDHWQGRCEVWECVSDIDRLRSELLSYAPIYE